MKKGILILICSCCLTIYGKGQINKVDSLRQLIITAENDTIKLKAETELGFEVANYNPDSGIFFIGEALALAKKIKYRMGMANAYSTMGHVLTYVGKFKEALNNFREALKIYDELLASPKTANRSGILRHKGDVYNNTGFVNLILSDFTEALKNFSTALRIYREIGDKRATANPISNTGKVYYQQGNFPEALKYFLAAFKIYEETEDKNGSAGAYNDLGVVYLDMENYKEALKNFLSALKLNRELGGKNNIAGNLTNIGNVYMEQGNLSEALQYQKEALLIAEEIRDNRLKVNCYDLLGDIYAKQGNYSKAVKYHADALKISEELGDREQMTCSVIGLGNDYLKMKNYHESAGYLNKGLTLAKEIGDKIYIKDSYFGLALLDSAQGNYKRSLEYYKRFIEYKDSLVNEEKSKKLVQLQMQYDFDKKESLAKAEQEKKDVIVLKELQRQKLLRDFFIGLIGLVLVLSFFVYRTYRDRQLLRLNDIRNKIAGDLHDDIGSTLNSISIYSEVAKKNDDNHDEALEMIGDASRKVIDAMSDIVWTINSENDSFEKIIFRMKSLAYNLFRAKNIEFTFHAGENLNDKKLSLEQRRNFYLIFKEAVNNLVKYSNANRAAITVTNDNNLIKLRIRDDGVGFDMSQDNAGNGLKNMRRRADEMKAELKIESQSGSGTQIELILKA